MARNRKNGVDYFPFDVDFFQDIKVRKLIRSQGGKAVAVYALLLCNIYKSGYYVRWDEELPFIISEVTGYDEVYISEVIKSCLKVGLFDALLFDKKKILTSKGIQERYFEIVKRRVGDNSTPYLLISATETPISATETPISATETPISATESTQNKKESKVNKTKEKNKIKKEKVEGEDPIPVEKIVADFMESQQQTLDAYCMKNQINRKEFGEFMLEILNEWILTGWNPSPIKKGRGDYESFHFLNTMRIKINERKKRTNETDKTDRLQRRRGADSTAQSRKGFNGTL